MQLSLFVTALASLAASAFAADPLTIDTPCVFSVSRYERWSLCLLDVCDDVQGVAQAMLPHQHHHPRR